LEIYLAKQKDRVGEVIGNLTLISREGNYYICECSICKEDPELFGNGQFKIEYHNFAKGIVPCGCARAPRWTEEQHKVRIKRKLQGFPNLEFIKLDYSEGKVESKISLKCKIHGTLIDTVSIHTFFGKRYKGMCIDCEKEIISSRKTKDLEDYSEVLKEFPEGTFILRSEIDRPLSKDGHKSGKVMFLNCGICSYDKFVQAGLCDGIFKTTLTKSANKPCRCSGKFKYTDEQIKFRIEEIFSEKGITHCRFGGIVSRITKHKNIRRIIFSCDIHGYYVKDYSSINFDNKLCTCPSCSLMGGYKSSKTGYLYVLDIYKEHSEDFVGFGITNIPNERLRVHRNNLQKQGKRINYPHLFYRER
jgi:hypothetical protein